MKDPFVENYDLERNVIGFQTKGLAVVPRGEYKEKFINRIKSLGLDCPEPSVDVSWACWIFENKELNN